MKFRTGLRRGGSPIDVRGEALKVAAEMGVFEKIKAKEFIHSDEIVDANDETLVTYSINDQAEYIGDIEIHRDDLLDVLYENIPVGEVEFIFGNRIAKLMQHEDGVNITFKNGANRKFDFVFGADGTHSAVRKLAFGEEENYSKFFGAYFAGVEAPGIQSGKQGSGVVMYKEPGKGAALYPFKKAPYAVLFFRCAQLDYDYRNHEQQKEILKKEFEHGAWKIPEILNAMLQSDNLYFDEVVQIHMDAWSKGRVALVGDAAYTASFPTGMGTTLAMQGATILAQQLHQSNGNYVAAFSEYFHII